MPPADQPWFLQIRLCASNLQSSIHRQFSILFSFSISLQYYHYYCYSTTLIFLLSICFSTLCPRASFHSWFSWLHFIPFLFFLSSSFPFLSHPPLLECSDLWSLLFFWLSFSLCLLLLTALFSHSPSSLSPPPIFPSISSVDCLAASSPKAVFNDCPCDFTNCLSFCHFPSFLLHINLLLLPPYFCPLLLFCSLARLPSQLKLLACERTLHHSSLPHM